MEHNLAGQPCTSVHMTKVGGRRTAESFAGQQLSHDRWSRGEFLLLNPGPHIEPDPNPDTAEPNRIVGGRNVRLKEIQLR